MWVMYGICVESTCNRYVKAPVTYMSKEPLIFDIEKKD